MLETPVKILLRTRTRGVQPEGLHMEYREGHHQQVKTIQYNSDIPKNRVSVKN